jgi:Mn-dependent DtxR family transcriptional regulator
MVDVRVEHMLRVFGMHSKRVAEEALAPLGVRPTEYDVMEIISRYMANPDVESLTLGVIAERMGNLKATTCNYLGNLRRSGYVREAAGGSRLLTASGEAKLEECRHALRHSNRYLTDLFQPHVLEGMATAFLTNEEQGGAPRH